MGVTRTSHNDWVISKYEYVDQFYKIKYIHNFH